MSLPASAPTILVVLFLAFVLIFAGVNSMRGRS
jgi:hypothetical protein